MVDDMADETAGVAQGSAVDVELLKDVIDVVRPSLQADGGDCNFVSVDEDGVVTLELVGACAGCALSSVTLGMGIERILKEHVPGVTRVVAATDNAEAQYGSFMGAGMGWQDQSDDDDIPSLL